MPSRDDAVTTTCPVCGHDFTANGRRRWCSAACRQAAYRRRHQPTLNTPELPPPTRRRDVTIYECNNCGTRQLGEQRCPDCGTFGRRIGPGGTCPHCDEPVAIQDLTDTP